MPGEALTAEQADYLLNLHTQSGVPLTYLPYNPALQRIAEEMTRRFEWVFTDRGVYHHLYNLHRRGSPLSC